MRFAHTPTLRSRTTINHHTQRRRLVVYLYPTLLLPPRSQIRLLFLLLLLLCLLIRFVSLLDPRQLLLPHFHLPIIRFFPILYRCACVLGYAKRVDCDPR